MCDEIYSDIQYKWCKLCNFMCWKSGDVKIDSLIQLKINKPSDTRFKWISYNQFNKIRNIDKGHFVTVHSAIWKYEETEVALVCFNDSQKFLNKVKEHANSFKMYGISQNPKKKNYILVLENEYCTEYGKTYCKNCGEKYGHADHSWCRQCLITATSINNGNEKIDDLIQEMQLKINSPFNIIFEWIPYDQFNYIKEIGKGGFATVYSAIWKDGPIKYDVDEEMCTRVSNKKVALKCLNNSQNMIDKFLSEVREYSINKMDDILNVYGVSQNPNTNDYIIVIEYADGGSYNNWIDINYKDFDWRNKIQTLLSIIEDMGLCEDVNNTSEEKTYGVIPYMAPEVLRGMPYTQAADIYSFGICDGIRPEINELEIPKCYIDLMKRCWDSNPNNRPSVTEINVGIKSFYNFYNSYKKGDSNATEIRKQFKEAEIYRKSLPSLKKNKQHPEAIYTSRLLDPFTKDLPKYDNSECISCAIIVD
ncbi:kinase-like domain-containing protein [Rhizophagus irregularis DAOM 181602=DAOM 197198]|nr:kinase-like domain-containing protein [Rhizophagus irregularis DAOM 181602=DAOM 197198]